ncbi:hypothetical protein KAJ41_02355 [Candidatus Parcubacteria bacterium]|nr:hypothetical protein [Candidatus Parcubacteria bacterium]
MKNENFDNPSAPKQPEDDVLKIITRDKTLNKAAADGGNWSKERSQKKKLNVEENVEDWKSEFEERSDGKTTPLFNEHKIKKVGIKNHNETGEVEDNIPKQEKVDGLEVESSEVSGKFYNLNENQLSGLKSLLNQEERIKREGNWQNALIALYNIIGEDSDLPDYFNCKGFNVYKESENYVLIEMYYQNEIYKIDIEFKEDGINVNVQKEIMDQEMDDFEETPIAETETPTVELEPTTNAEAIERLERMDRFIKLAEQRLEDTEKELSEVAGNDISTRASKEAMRSLARAEVVSTKFSKLSLIDTDKMTNEQLRELQLAKAKEVFELKTNLELGIHAIQMKLGDAQAEKLKAETDILKKKKLGFIGRIKNMFSGGISGEIHTDSADESSQREGDNLNYDDYEIIVKPSGELVAWNPKDGDPEVEKGKLVKKGFLDNPSEIIKKLLEEEKTITIDEINQGKEGEITAREQVLAGNFESIADKIIAGRIGRMSNRHTIKVVFEDIVNQDEFSLFKDEENRTEFENKVLENIKAKNNEAVKEYCVESINALESDPGTTSSKEVGTLIVFFRKIVEIIEKQEEKDQEKSNKKGIFRKMSDRIFGGNDNGQQSSKEDVETKTESENDQERSEADAKRILNDIKDDISSGKLMERFNYKVESINNIKTIDEFSAKFESEIKKEIQQRSGYKKLLKENKGLQWLNTTLQADKETIAIYDRGGSKMYEDFDKLLEQEKDALNQNIDKRTQFEIYLNAIFDKIGKLNLQKKIEMANKDGESLARAIEEEKNNGSVNNKKNESGKLSNADGHILLESVSKLDEVNNLNELKKELKSLEKIKNREAGFAELLNIIKNYPDLIQSSDNINTSGLSRADEVLGTSVLKNYNKNLSSVSLDALRKIKGEKEKYRVTDPRHKYIDSFLDALERILKGDK